MAYGNIRPIPEIFTDLIGQVTNLVRKEGQLARAEISEKATRALTGIAMILLGAVLLIPALVILMQAAIMGLIGNGADPTMAALIVGGAALLIGMVLGLIGWSWVKPASLVPDKTIDQLKRDAQVPRHSGITTLYGETGGARGERMVWHMATETERLERETEQTRAQLEQTLGELRARMSPSQLLDQATDYFRNSSGRAYLHNLRDEVVHNPVPITLIGAGIAWLALSGAIGHRGGRAYGGSDTARDWGRTAGIADELAHDGRGPSTMQRAKGTAQDWAHEAGEAISETEDRWRDRADDRVSTAYDETVGRVRQTAEGWAEDAHAAVDETRETLHEGAESVRERAGELYERTADGFRRVTRKASDYGRTARDAVRPDGALLNFCREQPMLVAGLGVAFGAALAAMIPASRVEREAMGDTSRKVQDRIKETAQDTWRAVGGEGRGRQDGKQSNGGAWSEDRLDRAANDSTSGQGRQGGIGRSEAPPAARHESWQSDAMRSREAAADVDRGVKQSDRASNIETEPSRAPYAEAAEAGAAGPGSMPGEETKQRT